MKLKNLSKDQKNNIFQSIKEKKRRPYKGDGVDYIYGVFDYQIIILPLEVVWELLDEWDLVRMIYDEKLTFLEAKDLFIENSILYNYCDEWIDIGIINNDERDDSLFFLTETYNLDVGFCDETQLMKKHLPKDIFKEKFMEETMTAMGEELVIIYEKFEVDIINYFKSKHKIILNSSGWIKEVLVPNWLFKEYL